MMTVTKEIKDGRTLILLSGLVDENADFAQALGQVQSPLIIDCSQIQRINSVGVSAWIRYFTKLQKLGVELCFVRCSIQIVQQLNHVSNFGCGGRIESIYVPYFCTGCQTEMKGLYSAET